MARVPGLVARGLIEPARPDSDLRWTSAPGPLSGDRGAGPSSPPAESGSLAPLRLTRRGRLLADAVVRDLLD